MKLFKLFCLTIALASLNMPLHADISANMNRWFDSMDYANITAPGVYEGQTARYMTFGGISTRAPVTEVFRFVDFQMPRFSAGCGGIDIYAGGFSAVDADQFIENLRNIGENAQGLAFMLAIQIVSPQLSNTIEYINDVAQKFNQYATDSCQFATDAINGIGEYYAAREGSCTRARMNNGEDWITARGNCGLGGNMGSTEENAEPGELEHFSTGNIAWHVLMQDGVMQEEVQMAQLIMNLTGTLVVRDQGDGSDPEVMPFRLEKVIDEEGNFTPRGKNIYTALLHGTDAEISLRIHTCTDAAESDPNGCQELSAQLQVIEADWVSLYQIVERELLAIMESIYDETPLDDLQMGIISSSRLPVYRYMTAAAAYYPQGMNLDTVIHEFVDVIANDIVLRNIAAVLEKVRQTISRTQYQSTPEFKEYRNDVSKVLNGISRLHEKNNQEAELYFSMQQRVKDYERAVMSKLSSGMLQSAFWGR